VGQLSGGLSGALLRASLWLQQVAAAREPVTGGDREVLVERERDRKTNGFAGANDTHSNRLILFPSFIFGWLADEKSEMRTL